MTWLKYQVGKLWKYFLNFSLQNYIIQKLILKSKIDWVWIVKRTTSDNKQKFMWPMNSTYFPFLTTPCFTCRWKIGGFTLTYVCWLLRPISVWIWIKNTKYKKTTKLQNYKDNTQRSLIKEHALLNFSDFLSTLLAIFHVINEKFHPACLLIYLVNKWAGWLFFPTLLVYSCLLVY